MQRMQKVLFFIVRRVCIRGEIKIMSIFIDPFKNAFI